LTTDFENAFVNRTPSGQLKLRLNRGLRISELTT